jgi:hypothetical protein
MTKSKLVIAAAAVTGLMLGAPASAQKFVGQLSGTALFFGPNTITGNGSANVYSVAGKVVIEVNGQLVTLTYSDLAFGVPAGYVQQPGFPGPQASFTLGGALIGTAERAPIGYPAITEPWFSNQTVGAGGSGGGQCDPGTSGFPSVNCGVDAQDGIIAGSTITGTMGAGIAVNQPPNNPIDGTIRGSRP